RFAADETGARQMRDRDRQFPLLMAHDDNHALGKRGDVIAAGTPVEIAHLPAVAGKRRVDIAEAVDFERPQKARVDDTAMQIHSHYVEKTAPACRAIEYAGIGKPYRRILGTHIGD